MTNPNHHKLPMVSIISVNYNQPGVTIDMLNSLQQISYPNYEVIVVDNGSSGDDHKLFTEKFPKTRVIRSEENLGFAGGNNLGVREAKGNYLLFLNNDTEVEPGFLEPLVKVFQTEEHVGMASPKIVYYDSPGQKTIQYAGSTGINPYTSRGRKIGSFANDEGQYDDIRETALGHGAAMMVPMSVINKAGLMADIYFLYYEEHDWCERIKRAGYRVFYVGTSKIYHKESVSVGRDTPLKAYYMNRGRLIYVRRNTAVMQRTLSLLFFAFLTIPKRLLIYALRREFSLLKAFVQACLWNVSHGKVKTNPHIQYDEQGKAYLINTSSQRVKKF